MLKDKNYQAASGRSKSPIQIKISTKLFNFPLSGKKIGENEGKNYQAASGGRYGP